MNDNARKLNSISLFAALKMLQKSTSGLRETVSSRALGSRDVDKKLTSHTLGQVIYYKFLCTIPFTSFYKYIGFT